MCDDLIKVRGGAGGQDAIRGGLRGDEGPRAGGEVGEVQDVAGPAAVQARTVAIEDEGQRVELRALHGGEDEGLRTFGRRGENAPAQLGGKLRRHEAELGAERARQHGGKAEDGAVNGRERTLQHDAMDPAVR